MMAHGVSIVNPTNPMSKTEYEKPPGQQKQSLDPKDYNVRVCVFGTRQYADRREFHRVLMAYLKLHEGEDILFISGAAKSGADRLIIDWCKKFGYPCLEMPADWDTYGKSAGYRRNTDMSVVMSHGLGFWDGKSVGTKHMVDIAVAAKRSVKIIGVTLPEEPQMKLPLE